jgi:hypothetical protein
MNAIAMQASQLNNLAPASLVAVGVPVIGGVLLSRASSISLGSFPIAPPLCSITSMLFLNFSRYV